MPAGLTTAVVQRLWKIVSLIISGKSRNEIRQTMGYPARAFSADIHRIKSLGLHLKYSRKTDKYSIEFPFSAISFKLSPEEFFYVLYFIKTSTEAENLKNVENKLKLALSDETDPVYDCGPAYGIGQNITSDLEAIFNRLKDAIIRKHKTVFFYHSLSSKPEIRIVHPYKLIHTPVSWYLVGFCEERSEFRNFKLARIDQVKTLSDRFHKKNLNLIQHLGDAWWLRHDPRKKNKYKIKVIFKNEAAQSIREYRFHSSQNISITDKGSVVTWELSYLDEFATWLMQWLPNFEIIRPTELKDMIKQKISDYSQKI